mmetsp:Transcript_29403/g.34986  ORF Transcript_29403/g.34986 Transcript_29403/m.34986 type:complete len:81 (+) Transcript_29403:432-674(+)
MGYGQEEGGDCQDERIFGFVWIADEVEAYGGEQGADEKLLSAVELWGGGRELISADWKLLTENHLYCMLISVLVFNWGYI